MNEQHQFINYGAAEQELQRRAQIAQALQAQAMSPIKDYSRGALTSKVSPMEVLAKLVQGYVGGRASKTVGEEQGKLKQRMHQEYAKELDDFYRNSTDREVMFLEETGPDGQPVTRVEKGDPRAAIFQALASQNPLMQQFAQERAKKLGDLKEVGGIVYDPLTRETVQLGGQRPQLVTRGGDLYEVNPSTGQLKKLDNSPRINVNTNVLTKGQSELFVGRAKAANEDLARTEEAAQKAQKTLGTVARLREITDTYSGPTASPAMWLGQLANSMGIKVDEKRLANSETFRSEATRMWLELMNEAGGARGLTEVESLRVERALPQLIQTPAGRQQMLDMIEARGMETIQAAQAKQKAMMQAAQADDPNLYFQAIGELGLPQFNAIIPESIQDSGGQSGKVIKWEDLQ